MTPKSKPSLMTRLRKKRIFIISASYPPSPGGVATHVANLSHGLLKLDAGIFVSVLTLAKKGHSSEYPGGLGGRLQVWKLKRKMVPHFNGRRVPLQTPISLAMNECQRKQPDLIHAHDFDSAYIGWMLKIAFNVPFVLTVHRAPSPWKEDKEKENPKDCFMEAMRVLNLADHLIVPSEASAQVLYKQGFLRDQITVIQHGINYKYLSSFTNLDSVLHKLNLDPSSYLILCPVRADEHKDPDVFVRAAAIIKKNNPNKKFVFLLTDEPFGIYQYLPTTASALGLDVGSEMIFKSFTYKEMPTLYRNAKVCVVPSLRESFGQTVLEAFVFKTPVVAANAAALQETVKHNQNGLLFTPNSAEELANQVQRILDDDKLVGDLKKNGIKDITQKYNVQRMVKEYKQLYERILT